MQRILTTAVALCFLSFSPALTACTPAENMPFDSGQTDPGPEEGPGGGNDNGDGGNDTPMNGKLKITIGGATFTAVWADRAAARAFAALLPMTVPMSDVNQNEKCFYLDRSLPTDASRPGTIRAGDLMLWGDDCVVLFYETFASPYSYTPIGRVEDPSGLAAAVGKGRVTVAFSRER